MADPVTITEHDVSDKNLLLRFLRKVGARLGQLVDRVDALERAPQPPTSAQIRNDLMATGKAPLNLSQLPGVAREVQISGARRYFPAPDGLVLQQFQDTQFVLVGTTSTGFALNTVVAGNPSVMYQLLGGLSTASVASTSTNVMTLDTVQTSTGAKTLTGVWTHNANVIVNAVLGVGGTPSGTVFPVQIITASSGTPYGMELVTNGVESVSLDVSGGGGQFATDSVQGDAILRAGSNLRLLNGSGVSALKIDTSNNVTVQTVFTASTAATVSGVFTAQSTAVFESNILSSGVISKYHGITTTAEGVPYILSRSAQINKTSSVATTTLYTTTATGEYRLSYFIECIATGTSIPTLQYSYSNDAASRGVSSTGLTLNLVGIDEQKSVFLRNASGSVIQYNVSFGTATSTSPAGTYSVFVLLERLS